MRKDLGMLNTGAGQPRIVLVANNDFGMQAYIENQDKKAK